MTGTDPLWLVPAGYLAMIAVMTGLWLFQLKFRNTSIADVGWCAGLIMTVFWYITQASGDLERKALIAVMVSIYAGRLGGSILFNRVIGKSEDARYRRLREEWAGSEQLKMFGYFQLQAVAVAAFSLPFLVVIQNPRPPFSLWELGGFLIWIAAVSGEAAADWQLAHFREKAWNRDRVCRDGLWFYSRHPNYFFEWLHWWVYVVMAIGAPGWPLTLIGPVTMGWALLKVTGIPLAEQQAVRTRGAEYRQYQETTNAFIPWWPR
jgi:steroid 5-alpha reductase family enzyme